MRNSLPQKCLQAMVSIHQDPITSVRCVVWSSVLSQTCLFMGVVCLCLCCLFLFFSADWFLQSVMDGQVTFSYKMFEQMHYQPFYRSLSVLLLQVWSFIPLIVRDEMVRTWTLSANGLPHFANWFHGSNKMSSKQFYEIDFRFRRLLSATGTAGYQILSSTVLTFFWNEKGRKCRNNGGAFSKGEEKIKMQWPQWG